MVFIVLYFILMKYNSNYIYTSAMIVYPLRLLFDDGSKIMENGSHAPFLKRGFIALHETLLV